MYTEERSFFWKELIPLIDQYLDENHNQDTAVVEYHSAKELQKLLNLKLSDNSVSDGDILAEIKKYLQYSPRTSHPQFNNQLFAGFNFYSFLGELVSFLTNTTMATYEVAPVASLMEKYLIDEMNKILGFKNGDGIMLTGGSNANMMAIHCARNKMFPETKFKGNMGREFAIYVSQEAHYSFSKAVNLMGIGMDNIYSIKSDGKGKMRVDSLRENIEQSKNEGKTPLMVASTSGTTVLGAFDPLVEIDKVAKEYKLWHHADGAWGGAVMFSQKTRHLIEGSELLDSFTFDAHKMLGTGVITSFFLTKESGQLESANSGGGSKYIFHEYENAAFDTGKKSIQCGRKVDVLKFWLHWKKSGHSGLEHQVNKQMALVQYMVSRINENDRLKLIREPEYLNVCFQVIPKDPSIDINDYNYKLRFHFVQEGRFLTNFARFEDGTTFFRHIIANNHVSEIDIDRLLNELLTFSESFKYE